MQHTKNQNGFIQHLISEIIRRQRTYAKHSELSAGFIPMMIMLLLLLVAAIIVVYMRVNQAEG